MASLAEIAGIGVRHENLRLEKKASMRLVAIRIPAFFSNRRFSCLTPIPAISAKDATGYDKKIE